MPLSDIQTAITNAVKPLELCDNYQDVLLATDESELIYACKDAVEWAMSNDIITDDLMAMFTDSILVANNIYNTGTHSLTNPGADVFITGDAIVTITVNNFNRSRIVVCSQKASLTVLGSDNAYIKIQRIKSASVVGVVLNNNAALIGNFEGDGIIDAQVNDDAVFHAQIWGKGLLNYYWNGNAIAAIKANEQASINIFSTPDDKVKVSNYQSSTIRYVDTSAL